MLIHFECPDGHRLKADSEFEGKYAPCPACGKMATVPEGRTDPLTDSGVVRLLDDGTLTSAAEQEAVKPRSKKCPRCAATLLASARLCSSCNLYVGVSEQTWNSVFNAAKRDVQNNKKAL